MPSSSAKRRVNYLLRRIYRLLDGGTVTVRFKHFHAKARRRGETDGHTMIWLDPKDEAVGTLVHECLHILYPKWCETRVLRMEVRIMYHISDRQVKTLLIKDRKSVV